jgi:uncharacterized protein (DUF302 family)/glutaredoxin
MLKLYQREECPYCAKVRRALTERGVSFQAINVPKLGSERREVLALTGVTKPEVPVLVDGDAVIQDSEAIVDHIRSSTSFGDPSYGLTRTLKGISFADAVPVVKEALGAEEFGVLTEIDVRATMKKKLDVDFSNYVILGACNPKLAHQALEGDPAIGLLLPCNVVVTEDQAGNAIVSAIDPLRMFSVIKRPDVEPIAKEVGARLRRVLAALPGGE